MRQSLLLLFGFIQLHLFAQVIPQASPYAVDGPYTVVADSDMTVSPTVLSYRPAVTPAQPLPVFIFQLGANSFFSTAINAHTYDIYLKQLASWGYVVVIVNDPNAGIPNGTSFTTVHNWFKTKAADNTHWMHSYADTAKVVIGGHSNGGVNATSLLLSRPGEIKGIVYFASYPSTFFPSHDVSHYTGRVLDLAGASDATSTPTSCRNGYNSYVASSCRTWVLITGMDHGGFGDYVSSSQPVGPIGRDSATATVRHYLVSFMESQFKNDLSAFDQLSNPALRPNTVSEFLSNCSMTSTEVSNLETPSLRTYPNPFSNELQLELGGFKDRTSLKVVDVLGNTLYARELENPSALTSLRLEELPAGMYLLVLSDGKNALQQAIIKQ